MSAEVTVRCRTARECMVTVAAGEGGDVLVTAGLEGETSVTVPVPARLLVAALRAVAPERFASATRDVKVLDVEPGMTIVSPSGQPYRVKSSRFLTSDLTAVRIVAERHGEDWAMTRRFDDVIRVML